MSVSNRLEVASRKFGFTNADCLSDERLARLVRYKADLDERIDDAQTSHAVRLGKVAGFSEAEVSSDRRLVDLLKGVIRAREHLATLRVPGKKKSPAEPKPSA